MGFERFKKKEKENIGYLDLESNDVDHLKAHLERLQKQKSIEELTGDQAETVKLIEQVRTRIAELEEKAA